MRALLAATAVLLPALLRAQVDGVPRDLIEQRIEDVMETLGDDTDVDLTNLFEVLTDRYLDPIDLNHCTPEDLNAILMLNDVQVASLLEHIRRNGKLLSIYELQTVRGWDARTIEMVRPFVTVRESPTTARLTWKNILSRGTHELIVRSMVDVEQRRGYMYRSNPFGKHYLYPSGKPLPDLGDPAVVDSLKRNNAVYLGSPYKLYTRYRFRYRHNISAGITAEKDEGEEFFQGTQQRGFDLYSAHLFLRDLGRVKALAIGDYQAQFGQGLTFWNGLAFGSKGSYTMNVKRNATGITPYTSVNENLFMRGAAATVEVLPGLDLTAFHSRKGLDATITSVPAGQDTTDAPEQDEVIFSSFQEGGFHRTTREVERRHAVDERITGAHLRWNRPAFNIGLTAADVAYGGTLRRNVQPYNQFEFQGRRNAVAGGDWNVLYRNLTWFGEVAVSSNARPITGLITEPPAADRISWNTGVLVALDRRVSLGLLYRGYGRAFQNLYSVAFGEGINPWNQHGLYTGLEVRPNRQWSFNAFFDQWRTPWLRYQVNAPSNGTDWLAQLNWRPKRNTELYFRVRRRDRPYNTALPVEGIRNVVTVEQANYRINAAYKVSNSVSLRTRVETIDYQRGTAALKHGFILYQDIVHRPLGSPVELTLRFALFETDGYDARLYAYEHDLIGVFSIPPYYGRGIRWYGMVRATPLRRVDLWLRYGAWIYRDQQSIGSGLQEIAGHVRSDIKVQARWRF